MDLAEIPVLSLDMKNVAFSAAIGASFRRFGFAMVTDHGIAPELIAQGWALTEAFFALREAEKRQYHRPDLSGARGYTPFRTEIAKGAAAHDLKEFWHVGRDLAPGSPLATSMPPNIWPDAPEGFARDLGLDADWFAPAIHDGNSVLRLLHYPPITQAPQGAIRAGAHEDINLITLLLGAQEAGLELLTKEGHWAAVAPPEGAMVINIGDMLQRLTNHVLPSTTHRVRNPDGLRCGHSRYSMPFFLHLRSDFEIKTLPGCITPDNPDRYPIAITADAYLQERLREIGLRA